MGAVLEFWRRSIAVCNRPVYTKEQNDMQIRKCYRISQMQNIRIGEAFPLQEGIQAEIETIIGQNV